VSSFSRWQLAAWLGLVAAPVLATAVVAAAGGPALVVAVPAVVVSLGVLRAGWRIVLGPVLDGMDDRDAMARRLESDRSRLAGLQAEIDHASTRDRLTGLITRQEAVTTLEAALTTVGAGPGRPLSVALLDIDQFRLVNDTFGHQTADRVLQEVAARITDAVADPPVPEGPDRITVTRWSGDQFLLILPGADAELAGLITDEAVAALQRPIPVPVDGHDVTVTITVTAVTATARTPIPVDRILKQVDHRLAVARGVDESRGSTGPPEVRSSAVTGPVVGAGRDADDDRSHHRLVRDAIAQNRLEVWFQPIFSVRNDELVLPTGAEALVRLRTEDGEVVAPSGFLPGVDRSDLGRKLDERVAAIALDHLNQWHQAGLIDPGFRLSLNLCESSASDVSFTTFLAGQMRRFRINPERVIIELPESAAQINRTVVERIRQLGVTVAIDDFGLASSNLDRAEDFRAEIVKLDRRWMGPPDRPIDDRERQILRSLIDLCSSLDVHVVAEGIETIDQLLLLLDLGVSDIQGYFLSKPLAAADFTALVARYQGRDRALVVG
jgi:diguanylate cyclase (GGDEF)-like protein